MTESLWPNVDKPDDVVPALKEMQRIREQEDISNYTNLPNRFLQGRTTDRVPSTPADVISTDNEGDVVIDSTGTFKYELVNVSGTLTWAREAINTSW